MSCGKLGQQTQWSTSCYLPLPPPHYATHVGRAGLREPMGWMGGAGGCTQVRPLPSRWAGLPRVRLKRPRAGKESKGGEERSGGLSPIPKAAVSGRAEEGLNGSVWSGGDIGSEARRQRRHERVTGVGRAATQAALTGHKQSPGKVESRPCSSPPPTRDL